MISFIPIYLETKSIYYFLAILFCYSCCLPELPISHAAVVCGFPQITFKLVGRMLMTGNIGRGS